jgi:glucokinase
MRVVLGMDFGGTKIALAVCDLDGRCLAQHTLATCAEDGGTAVLHRGIAGGQALLNQLAGSNKLAPPACSS